MLNGSISNLGLTPLPPSPPPQCNLKKKETGEEAHGRKGWKPRNPLKHNFLKMIQLSAKINKNDLVCWLDTSMLAVGQGQYFTCREIGKLSDFLFVYNQCLHPPPGSIVIIIISPYSPMQ